MGYIYTPPPQAAGVDELWRFKTSAPTDNIELNTTVGVQGIDAPLPADNRLRWILSVISGLKSVGALFVSGTDTLFNGITLTPLRIASVIARNATKTAGLIVDLTNYITQISSDSTTTLSNTITTQTSITDNVSNASNNLQCTSLTTQKTTQIFEGKLLVSEEVLSLVVNYMRLNTPNGVVGVQMKQDGAGAGADLAQLLLYYLNGGVQDEVSCNTFKDYAYLQYATDYAGVNDRMQVKAYKDNASIEFNDIALFKIDKTGKIESNQAQALTLVNPTVTKRVPFYDTTGALIGYIPLMVDP
jgi:hypothetical protein